MIIDAQPHGCGQGNRILFDIVVRSFLTASGQRTPIISESKFIVNRKLIT